MVSLLLWATPGLILKHARSSLTAITRGHDLTNTINEIGFTFVLQLIGDNLEQFV